MSITVGTSKLIDHLTDALATAGPGVHLTTGRGPWRDEPGDVDLFVATSSNRHVLGHTWIPCDGSLTAAVWPCSDTRTLLGVLKVLSKKGENHTVDITMVQAEAKENAKTDAHPGWIVTVSETKALFDSDTEFQFHADHESRFPLNWAMRILSDDFERPDDEYVETPLTLWGSDSLKRLASVAARRGTNIQCFRSSERLLQLVQIGDTWIGAAAPIRPAPGHGHVTSGPTEKPVLPYAPGYVTNLRDGFGLFVSGGDDDEQDVLDEAELLRQAAELVVTTSFASNSSLQRKLKIGYGKAARVLDALEGVGIVGAADGSRAREVLFAPDAVGEALEKLGD